MSVLVRDFTIYRVLPCTDVCNRHTSAYIDAIEDGYDLTKAERKDLIKFAVYVDKQAVTKRGRFIRVVFKSKHSEKKHVSKSGIVYARPHAGQNRRVDLVPKGSIASGMELIKNDKRRKAGWRFVSPDIEKLWDEYP